MSQQVLTNEERRILSYILDGRIAQGDFQSNSAATKRDEQGCDAVENHLVELVMIGEKLGLTLDTEMIERAERVNDARRAFLKERS